MLLAIDPGVDTGWALFSASCELVACGLGDPRLSRRHRIEDIDEVVIEHPFVYPGGQTKDPNAIVKLAINAGEWSGTYKTFVRKVSFLLPWQWKGTTPKDINHARTWARLSDAEKTVVDTCMVGRNKKPVAPSKRHNVMDAIGIGLFSLDRAGEVSGVRAVAQ